MYIYIYVIDKQKNRMRMGNSHHDRTPRRHALGLHHETGVDERLEVHFVVVLGDHDSSESGSAEGQRDDGWSEHFGGLFRVGGVVQLARVGASVYVGSYRLYKSPAAGRLTSTSSIKLITNSFIYDTHTLSPAIYRLSPSITT